jgi:hypothetical protein
MGFFQKKITIDKPEDVHVSIRLLGEYGDSEGDVENLYEETFNRDKTFSMNWEKPIRIGELRKTEKLLIWGKD